jgi:hypothetical protein
LTFGGCFAVIEEMQHLSSQFAKLPIVLLLVLDLLLLGYLLHHYRTQQIPSPSGHGVAPIMGTPTPTPKPLNPELAWVKHASFQLPKTLSIGYDTYVPSCGGITDKPQTASDPVRTKYSYIYFCFNSRPIPTGFRYDLGPVNNPPPNITIKPFTINGYTGIRGKVFNSYYRAEEEEIDLQSPHGRYAYILLQHGDVNIFNQFLCGLTFHP